MNAHAYSDDAMAQPVEASSAHSHAVADAVGETAVERPAAGGERTLFRKNCIHDNLSLSLCASSL